MKCHSFLLAKVIFHLVKKRKSNNISIYILNNVYIYIYIYIYMHNLYIYKQTLLITDQVRDWLNSIETIIYADENSDKQMLNIVHHHHHHHHHHYPQVDGATFV